MTAESDTELSLSEHLIELRQRLIRSLVVIAVCVLALTPFARQLYHLLALPMLAALPHSASMIATGVVAPFFAPFKFSALLGLFAAMPYILYQAWTFVAPGLYRNERALALPILVSSILLFYVGAAFAYFVVFPMVFGFMVSAAPEGVAVMTDISSYLDFVVAMFLAFGLAFEVPVITVVLALTGVIDRQSLIRYRPYVIVIAFVLGMFLTPPDVISQILLAIPIWLLYELGLVIAKLLESRAASMVTPER